MDKKITVTIAGGGLVGALMAIFLKMKGFSVDVFEKRKDPRLSGASEGRSINLALSHRGFKSLKKAGLLAAVKDLTLAMEGRMMHDLEGQQTFQRYGTQGQAIYSVSRDALNTLLLEKAEELGVNLIFETDCEWVDFEKKELLLNKKGEKIQQSFEALVGSDGAYSKIRTSMMYRRRFDYAQEYIPHGYKELRLQPNADGDFALDPKALHIWPRGKYMLIALPNLDKSFTCTLFLAFEHEKRLKEPCFEALTSPESVRAFFNQAFPDISSMMADLEDQFFQNPTGSLVTIRCAPWDLGTSILIGDASHAIVPFYGQGMNAGFEDCFLLNQALETHGNHWEAALQSFASMRKKDADAIADLALQNFREMRDRVADENFLLRKKLEAQLHQAYPDLWIPQYSLVTFSSTPYAEALQIGHHQEHTLEHFQEEIITRKAFQPEGMKKIIQYYQEIRMKQ